MKHIARIITLIFIVSNLILSCTGETKKNDDNPVASSNPNEKTLNSPEEAAQIVEKMKQRNDSIDSINTSLKFEIMFINAQANLVKAKTQQEKIAAKKEYEKALDELKNVGGSKVVDKIIASGLRNTAAFRLASREIEENLKAFGEKVEPEFIQLANCKLPIFSTIQK